MAEIGGVFRRGNGFDRWQRPLAEKVALVVLVLGLVAIVAFVWPPILAWPLGALSLCLSVALLLRAARRTA